MTKRAFAILLPLLFAANAHALESITCSESLDEDLLATGQTDIGLGTENDGSPDGKDWELSINGKVAKISKFSATETGYVAVRTVSASAKVGVEYSFDLTDCDSGQGKLSVKQLGGFAGGTVTQKLDCGCVSD
jgi:hypothetical protein